MLEPDETIFPHNVVKRVAEAMVQIDPPVDGKGGVAVFKRALRNTDPMQSIGVFAQAWDPDPESIEMMGMMGGAPQMPTLQTYTLGLQAFVKDAEEERGLAAHSHLAQRTRSVLYTDPDLQLLFQSLSATLENGFMESMRRWGVRTARYFSGEIDAEMLYLTTLEFWIQTETRRTT